MAFRTNKMPVLQEKSASGSVATFNTALAMPLKSCTSLISGYQEGSGTPSPSNVRPLHAFSSASLYVSGKNIIDINDAHITSQTFSSNIFLKAGTYTLSANYNNVSNIIGYLRLNTRYEPITQLASITFTPNDSGRSSASFTLENDSICRFAFQGASSGYDFYVSNIMLEVGGSESSFEPYNGNTYTFTFGQDIYQGSIDWKRGVAVGEKAVIDLGSLAWINRTNYFEAPFTGRNAKPPLTNSVPFDGLCEIYKVSYLNDTADNIITMLSNGTQIYIRDTARATLSGTDYTSFLAGKYLAYKLATPIEIPLGGINLITQQGQNNIWADTGDVDLTYKDLDLAKRGSFREVFKLP